jgi:hypothetical protein
MQKVLEQKWASKSADKQFEQMSKMMKMMQGPGGKNMMRMMAEWNKVEDALSRLLS